MITANRRVLWFVPKFHCSNYTTLIYLDAITRYKSSRTPLEIILSLGFTLLEDRTVGHRKALPLKYTVLLLIKLINNAQGNCYIYRAGELAQKLRTHTALAGDLSSSPRIHAGLPPTACSSSSIPGG